MEIVTEKGARDDIPTRTYMVGLLLQIYLEWYDIYRVIWVLSKETSFHFSVWDRPSGTFPALYKASIHGHTILFDSSSCRPF